MSKGRPGRSDDGTYELESQFLLRLPKDPGQRLAEALVNGDLAIKDRLKIELESDMRKGKVLFDEFALRAKLWDLPTIIESFKTIDRKNFYKTADVCQVLQVYDADESTDEEASEPNLEGMTRAQREKKEKKKYSYPHGVTPPLKNIRRRRFRKTLKKKYADLPEIEKEVKRLLRVDCEAIDVQWELIDDNEGDGFGGGGSSSKKLEGGGERVDGEEANSGRVGEQELFGEELSESGSDDDEYDRPTLMAVKEEDEDSHLSGNGDDEQTDTSITQPGAAPTTSSPLDGFNFTVKLETSRHDTD